MGRTPESECEEAWLRHGVHAHVSPTVTIGASILTVQLCTALAMPIQNNLITVVWGSGHGHVSALGQGSYLWY